METISKPERAVTDPLWKRLVNEDIDRKGQAWEAAFEQLPWYLALFGARSFTRRAFAAGYIAGAVFEAKHKW